MNMCGRICTEIKSLTSNIPDTFGNSDLAVFKPRFFVEGENQFDCYHFVMPRVEVPSFYADNKEINIQKNTVLPTNPGQLLRVSPINKIYSNSNEIKFICMFIEPRKLKELTKEVYNKADLLFFNDTSFLSSNLFSLVTKFETESCNKQFGYQFILDSLTMEISINLIRELRSNMPEVRGLRKYSARKEINIAIDFLWENYFSEFSLHTLCNIVNLSPYYFVRLFKEHTGITPYEYYMDVKISKSLIYLKEKRYSITEIGFILGFSSHSHFSSVFKKKVGVTPTEYIKSIT